VVVETLVLPLPLVVLLVVVGLVPVTVVLEVLVTPSLSPLVVTVNPGGVMGGPLDWHNPYRANCRA
jgi:hypothetical protein